MPYPPNDIMYIFLNLVKLAFKFGKTVKANLDSVRIFPKSESSNIWAYFLYVLNLGETQDIEKLWNAPYMETHMHFDQNKFWFANVELRYIKFLQMELISWNNGLVFWNMFSKGRFPQSIAILYLVLGIGMQNLQGPVCSSGSQGWVRPEHCLESIRHSTYVC